MISSLLFRKRFSPMLLKKTKMSIHGPWGLVQQFHYGGSVMNADMSGKQPAVRTRVRSHDNSYSFGKCQKCSRKTRNKKLLVAGVPKLMHFWDLERNDSLNLDPHFISVYSTDIVWWKCKNSVIRGNLK